MKNVLTFIVIIVLRSSAIAGVNWVAANRVTPAAANLSFISTTASDALDTSVRNLISAGVTCVVFAGNNNLYAGTRSPARVTEAITVAALESYTTTALPLRSASIRRSSQG